MTQQSEITAIDAYYETANSEYDRIHAVLDQVDSKVGFLLALATGLPVVGMGLASGVLTKVGSVTLGLWGLGIVAFATALWHLVQAIRVRDVKLGIPYTEFREGCMQYGESGMREWVADILLEASEANYSLALKKATHMHRAVWPLMGEAVFLLAGTMYALVERL